MKKTILLFLFIFPVLAFADENKYGKGAVPETEGKVVFVKKIKVSKLSDTEVYNLVSLWIKSHFNTDTRRIVYENDNKRQIAVSADDYIVFKSSFLSLDRSAMRYNLVVEEGEGLLSLTYRGISYEYDFNADGKKLRLPAEQVITDANALTKKGSLNHYYGKFRQKTIDFINAQVKNVYDELDSVVRAKNQPKNDGVEMEDVKTTGWVPIKTLPGSVMAFSEARMIVDCREPIFRAPDDRNIHLFHACL